MGSSNGYELSLGAAPAVGRAKVLSSLRGPGLEVGPTSRPGNFRAWILPHLRIWDIPVAWVPF